MKCVLDFAIVRLIYYTGSRRRFRSDGRSSYQFTKAISSGDVNDWFQRYKICAKANGSNAAAKATRLPTLLEGKEGEALAIWLKLSGEQQEDYGVAKGEIEKAMRPMGFISLDDFIVGNCDQVNRYLCSCTISRN